MTKIARFVNYIRVSFTTEETILDKHNAAHQALVNEMNDNLYELWEYSKAGNTVVAGFMDSRLRDRLVQFKRDFYNTDIPEWHKNATYGNYKAIMEEITPLLKQARVEQRKGGAAC